MGGYGYGHSYTLKQLIEQYKAQLIISPELTTEDMTIYPTYTDGDRADIGVEFKKKGKK